MKLIRILLTALVLCFVFHVKTASATHIHFEDFSLTPISFNSDSSNNSYTWSFDLTRDIMSLWSIPEDEAANQSFDYVDKHNDFLIQEDGDHVYIGDGSIDREDDLHYAYLTMKFIGVNDGRNDTDNETVNLFLDLILQSEYSNYTISQGGTGALSVVSYLRDDFTLDVTIQALSGDFSVEWIDLSGCFETSTVPPVTGTVPEPATLLLFGSGLAGAFIRKYTNQT